MRDALAKVGAELGREYDLVIGGERLKTAARSARSIPRGRLRSSASTRRPARSTRQRPWPRPCAPSKPGAARLSDTRVSLLLNAADIIRTAQVRVHGLAHLRSGQELGRGRRRRGRDHRLPRVLRPRSPAPGRRHHAHPVPRRAQRASLHSARRGRGHSAVELPLRHHGRHDRGLHRLRQHRHPQALQRLAHHRRQVC